MGIWLYDVINLTGVTIGMNHISSSSYNLDKITRTIDKVTGYWDNRFEFHDPKNNVKLVVFDEGSWYLKIILQNPDSTHEVSASWYILKNYDRYSIVFETGKIWFYSTDKGVQLDGAVHTGWYVDLNQDQLQWAAYDLKDHVK